MFIIPCIWNEKLVNEFERIKMKSLGIIKPIKPIRMELE